MDMGLVQAYCGLGKGKTTAAIGQGIRALGSDHKVIMIQFLKGGVMGEVKTLKKLEPDFKVFTFEKKRDFFYKLSKDEKEELKMEIENALKFAKKVLETKECDVLILDEILGVIENEIISVESINEMIINKPREVEIILTGRILPKSMIENIDYISNIKKEKHPFDRGVGAREGIEY